jgi:hypothetical protein
MRLWIILAVLLLAAIAQAGEPADSTIERLAKVDRFAFGGIGFAGITSQGEKDYKLVFSRSSAMADFERLLSIGKSTSKVVCTRRHPSTQSQPIQRAFAFVPRFERRGGYTKGMH